MPPHRVSHDGVVEEPADPDARVAALREELRDRHATLGLLGGGDVERPEVDDLLALTSRLLDAESAAIDHHIRGRRTTTDRIVGGAVALLVVGASVTAVAGLVGGRMNGWGVAGVALAVVLAGVLGVADLVGSRPGSLTRRIDAGACVVGGAALLVAATGVLPWWGVVIAVVSAAGAAAHCLGLLPDLTHGRGQED